MAALSIGDLSRHLVLRHEMTRAKTDLASLVQEVASERKSDVAKFLRGEMSELASLESAIANLTTWSRTASLQASRLSGQQRALGEIDLMVQNLWANLTKSEPETPLSQRQLLAEDAAMTLDRMLAQLNVTIGAESLFAGTRTDQTAVSDGATLMTHIRGAVTGLTSAADIQAAVTTWFFQPGGYDDFGYKGGNERPGLRIGEQGLSPASVTALAPEVREALAGVALAALANDYVTPAGHEVGAMLLKLSADRLLAGSAERVSLMARVGIAEQHASQALSRNSAEVEALTLRRENLVGIDGYVAASALQGVSQRLELLYTVTARLSDLSLVRALR